MAGPGAPEVGRVGVRAVPITDRFAEELLADLKRIEKRIRFEVPVTADTSRLVEEIDAEKARVKDPVTVPVKAATDEFSRQVRADIAKLERSVEADIPLTADGEKFRRQLAEQIKGVEALLRVDVPIDLEGAAAFRQQVRAQLAEVEAMTKAIHPTVTIETDVDRDSVQRAEVGLVSGLAGAVASTGRLVAGLASAVSTAGLLAAAIIAVGAATVMIAPALLTILPALAGMGAAIGVLVVSAGALAKAFEPLAKAFKPLADQLSKIVTSGIQPLVKGLSGPLVNAVAPGLKVIADVLHDVIANVLQFVGSSSGLALIRSTMLGLGTAMRPLAAVVAPLTKAFLQLIQAATPALQILGQALATSVARFAAWVDAGFKSGAASKVIASAVQAMLSIFKGLGAVLGPLIGLFAEFGPAAVQGIVIALRTLGDVINMIRPLAAFIASNRALMVGLLTALAAAAVAFGGPIATAAGAVVLLVVGFKNLQGVLGKVGPALAPLTAGLSDLGGSLVSAVKTILPGVRAFASSVAPVLSDLGKQLVGVLGPALSQIGDIISGKLAPAFRDFLAAVGPIAAKLLSIFGPAFIAVLKGAVGVIKGIVTVIAGLFETLAGILTGDWSKAWDGLKTIAQGALQAVLGVVTGILGSILAQFKGFAEPMIGPFRTAGQKISEIWSATLAGVQQAASAVVGFFAGIGSAIGSAVSGAVSAAAGAVSGMARALVGALAAAFTAGFGVIRGIWSAFWSSSIGQLVKAGIDLVVAVVQLGLAVVTGIVRTVLLGLQLVVSAGWRAISAVVSAGMAVVQAVVSAAWGVVSRLTSSAVSAVRAVVSGGMAVVRSVVSAAMSAARSAVSAAWGFIGPFVTGAVDRVLAGVRRIGQVAGIVGGAFQSAYRAARDAIGQLLSLVGGLAGRVLSAIGNLGSTLFHAGAQLIQGLIDGVTSKIRALTSTISSITSKVKGFFPGSPVKEGPLRSFNDGKAGRRLVEMFLDGVKASGPDVSEQFARTFGAIPSPRLPSSAEMLAGRATAVGGGVNFNAPVNLRTPEEAAELILTRQRDAAALAGLRGAIT